VFFQFRVDVLFDLHLLGDGLDDDVRVTRRLLEVDQRGDPFQGRIGLVVADLAFLRELAH